MATRTETSSHHSPPKVENAGQKGFGIWLKPDAPPEWANYRNYDRWAKNMWRFNNTPGGIRVWDAGSGSGTRFKTLRTYIDPVFQITIVATDLQEEALSRFPQETETTRNPRDKVYTIQADITQPPPFTLPVHGISCLSVLPWVDIEGSKKALSYFYSQLEEQGALILELCTPLNQVALLADGPIQDESELAFRAKKMMAHFQDTDHEEPLTVFNQEYGKNVVVHTDRCATKLLEAAGFHSIHCTPLHNTYFPNGITSTLEERVGPNPPWKAWQKGREHENILIFAMK